MVAGGLSQRGLLRNRPVTGQGVPVLTFLTADSDLITVFSSRRFYVEALVGHILSEKKLLCVAYILPDYERHHRCGWGVSVCVSSVQGASPCAEDHTLQAANSLGVYLSSLFCVVGAGSSIGGVYSACSESRVTCRIVFSAQSGRVEERPVPVESHARLSCHTPPAAAVKRDK